MEIWLNIAALLLAAIAALFSFLVFLRAGQKSSASAMTGDEYSKMLRTESDRIRQASEDQGRSLRQELADSILRFPAKFP